MNPIRRRLLKTGAVATAMSAAPRMLAQQTGQRGAAMSFYEKGPVRIRYQEAGSGFPLLLMKGWGAELVKRRPDITTEMVDRFLTRMYRTNPDFVFTVTRDFVRTCQTPVLILPDDIPAHPYAVAMEAAMLAPKAEVSMFPWKEPKERIPLAVRQIRSFLRAHRPASV
ncbi:MAG: hypothetical protein ACT4QD_20645 [Acidobacteriota bacterium]